MAFNRGNTARNSNNNAQGQNESWKAQGFLNLYLPTANGGRRKLGAIPLKEAKSNERQMLEWLKEDPTRVETILSKLEIEFRTAESDEGSGFDLG